MVLEPDASSLLSKLFAILHDEYSEYELVEAVIAQGGLKKRRSGSIEPSPRQAVGNLHRKDQKSDFQFAR